jgi:hypothetical protein
MKLDLYREPSTEKLTYGKLFVNGIYQCETLEDPVRAEKIKNVTAIPAGKYSVVLTHSPRFGRVLPLVERVPGFEGVRFHPGNKPEDTEGCILTGTVRAEGMILNSRKAFDALFTQLMLADDDPDGVVLEIHPCKS